MISIYIYIHTHIVVLRKVGNAPGHKPVVGFLMAFACLFARAMTFHTNLEGARCVLSKPGPLSDSQRYIRAQWDEHEGNLGNWS